MLATEGCFLACFIGVSRKRLGWGLQQLRLGLRIFTTEGSLAGFLEQPPASETPQSLQSVPSPETVPVSPAIFCHRVLSSQASWCGAGVDCDICEAQYLALFISSQTWDLQVQTRVGIIVDSQRDST